MGMRARLRAMVVDDEPLAVETLAALLGETGRVDVVGAASGPEEALAFPRWPEVDVAFLDIVMPGMTGIELALRLPADPLVVFVTGYNQYAEEAFRVKAAYYLLKPVDRHRLDEMLNRVEGLLGDREQHGAKAVAEQVARYLRSGASRGVEWLEHVGSRLPKGLKIIEVAEVTHFAAADRIVFAVTAGKRYPLDVTMEDLERRLDPARFVRIHRGSIVNLAHADLIPDHPARGIVLQLKNGEELDVSRDRLRALRERLGL